MGENADQIAGHMKVPPEYALRAGNKFAEKIIRGQINLESGIAFSQVSCELFNVVDQDSMEDYTQDLKKFFAQQNPQMGEVSIQNKA